MNRCELVFFPSENTSSLHRPKRTHRMSKPNRLILIAGPAASGKTFLLNSIRKGNCSRLCEQLGIDHPASWHYSNVFKLISGEDALEGNQLVHCDLYNEDIFKYVRSILTKAPSATVITLCAPPSVLTDRNKKRMLKKTAGFLRDSSRVWQNMKLIRTLWFRQNINKSPLRLISLYNHWFDLLQEFPATQYWMESTAFGADPLAHPQNNDRSAALRIVEPRDNGSSRNFPMIGTFSSNHWKSGKPARILQNESDAAGKS